MNQFCGGQLNCEYGHISFTVQECKVSADD